MRNHYVDKKLLSNFALRKRFRKKVRTKKKKEVFEIIVKS